MPESRIDRDRECRPVSPPVPSRHVSKVDLFELLTEMRGNMSELRDEVAMLRAGLGYLHAEIAAIQGDIAGLRRTGGYWDGGDDGGIGDYRIGIDGRTGGFHG
ncbi:uncharacterized protein LOC111381947 [Olea europaea var. sylvestris]|uniref:uncharacterized protein LOC111381947 n=1 Tax=Olea europaea var. sylvestris TaxID=158386 RepID=UPI000C1D0EB3|nr:uncharacterized protein LOC111381947 [Olea europaea var. sylvestris]